MIKLLLVFALCIVLSHTRDATIVKMLNLGMLDQSADCAAHVANFFFFFQLFLKKKNFAFRLSGGVMVLQGVRHPPDPLYFAHWRHPFSVFNCILGKFFDQLHFLEFSSKGSDQLYEVFIAIVSGGRMRQ